MFIATANALDLIPGPLLDRLEVITLLGYTEEEKEKIATHYLIPKEIEDTGGQIIFIEAKMTCKKPGGHPGYPGGH